MTILPKMYPHTSPHLQIRPSLVHPFLSHKCILMLCATHGHLASKNENKRQENIGRWFDVMTAGPADKVALYWYAEPSVLTHRSWCGDYTHTHACTRTESMQHPHKNMHPRTHATLTRTHAATHARNTHTHTRTHAPTH